MKIQGLYKSDGIKYPHFTDEQVIIPNTHRNLQRIMHKSHAVTFKQDKH